MAGALNNTTYAAQRIYNGMAPFDLPKAMSISVDFTYAAAQPINLDNSVALGVIDFIQSVFVDNSANNATLTLTIAETQQEIIFPAYSQGYAPVLAPNPPHFTVSCASTTGNKNTWIQFCNIPFPYHITVLESTGNNNSDTGSLVTLATQSAGTVVSADQININCAGVVLGIDITAITGGATLTVSIQGKDTASGLYYTIASSTALAATGFSILKAYPGITVIANQNINDVLPRTWRVQAIVAVGTVTGTIGASVIL